MNGPRYGCAGGFLSRHQLLWQVRPGFAETDLDRANYETTISDLMTGQHSDPLRVVMFNTGANRAEDVSYAIAEEILRRLGLEGATYRPSWKTSLIATSVRIAS